LADQVGVVQRALDQATGIHGLNGRLHNRGEIAA